MKPDVSPALQAADKALKGTGHVVVRGPTGSGLHTVMAALAERPKLAVLELRRPGDADASAAALLEAAGFLNITDRKDALAAAANIGRSVRMIVDALNQQQRGLVLVVGPGWNRVEHENEEGTRLKRVRLLLQEVARVQRLVVLADLQVDLAVLGFQPPDASVALEAPLSELDVTVFPDGAYREHAEQLGRTLPGHRASPIVWRLGVGLLGLGEPLSTVASMASRPTAEVLAQLVLKLVGHLRSRPNVDLESAVKRALIFRTTVPEARLVELSQIPREHQALVTSCIGYGEPVRISPIVRKLLTRHLSEDDSRLSDTHVELAKYYRTLDGVPSPTQVQSPAQMSAWVERAHHLAEAGVLAGDEWAALERPCPELYWDRGRALSLIARDFEGSAAVYEECVRKFPDDDYAAHYAGYNLVRAARRDDKKALSYFSKAVELAPENPWWNHRYIAALIDSGQFTEARGAWKQALAAIDPDGAVTNSSTWLVENLFVPVARAWVRKGCWRDAWRVIVGIQAQFMEHHEMRELDSGIQRQAKEERGRLQTWIDGHAEPEWRAASATLKKLESLVEDLPTPAATTGEVNAPVLAWSLDEILVELEFQPANTMSWYARERSAAKGEGGDVTDGVLSAQLLAWLARVARA